MDKPNNNNKPTYNFYFRCKACDAPLNHNSYNVKNGINESPYCSRCASYSFDNSNSDREYEHQYLSELDFSGNGIKSEDFD
ncbi:hypothetical protein EPNKCIFM_00028 [Klebsiella phage KP13-16]|nr:hypothetical protein vBKpMFBKp34_194 [Klebsiella phage vB_KpM_FBKp34]UYL04349.1 hypothetical protein EPNKCIFM_00028 [Klebsiella phage KP13-16]